MEPEAGTRAAHSTYWRMEGMDSYRYVDHDCSIVRHQVRGCRGEQLQQRPGRVRQDHCRGQVLDPERGGGHGG